MLICISDSCFLDSRVRWEGEGGGGGGGAMSQVLDQMQSIHSWSAALNALQNWLVNATDILHGIAHVIFVPPSVENVLSCGRLMIRAGGLSLQEDNRPGLADSREAEAGGIMSTGTLALSLQYLATDPYSARTPLHIWDSSISSIFFGLVQSTSLSSMAHVPLVICHNGLSCQRIKSDKSSSYRIC